MVIFHSYVSLPEGNAWTWKKNIRMFDLDWLLTLRCHQTSNIMKHHQASSNIIKSHWLVVSTILKNMEVNGKDDNPCMMEHKNLFQTTKQIIKHG
jgi:hypothetical protein